MPADAESLALAEHEGLVQHICARYSQHPEYEDILQLARIGLLNAVRKHDPKRGRLSTLAAYCIRREVFGYFHLGVSKKRLSPFVEISLDAPFGEHDLLGDCVGLDDPAYAKIEACMQSEHELAKLDPRTRGILIMRSQDFFLREIADAYGVTKQRIQQIEWKAQKEMRKGIALSEHV